MSEAFSQLAHVVPVHCLYLGSRDGDPWDREDRNAVIREAAGFFESFTINEADGYYEGRPVPTLILRIGTDNTDRVTRLADVLGRITQQREIGLEVNGFYGIVAINSD